MPSEATNEVHFTGQFSRTVDEKNRLTIPADWRFSEGGVLYVRVHKSGSHATVLLPSELKKTVDELNGRRDKTLAERQVMIRMVSSSAHRCAVDKQGRMVLPPEVCDKAGLRGEVTLLGGYESFEIWNPERWAAQTADPALEAELGL